MARVPDHFCVRRLGTASQRPQPQATRIQDLLFAQARLQLSERPALNFSELEPHEQSSGARNETSRMNDVGVGQVKGVSLREVRLLFVHRWPEAVVGVTEQFP